MNHRLASSVSFVVTIGILAFAVLWFFSSPRDIEAIGQLTSVAQTLGLLIAIGFLAGASAMAAVQVCKNLYPVRGHFHVAYLRRFFGDAVWPDLSRLASGGVSRTRWRILENLTRLSERPGDDHYSRLMQSKERELDDFSSLSDYEHYLRETARWSEDWIRIHEDSSNGLITQWDAPIEQVVAQLGQVSEFVLARPRGRVALLRRFAAAQARRRPGDGAPAGTGRGVEHPADLDVVDRYVIAVFSPEDDNRKRELDDLAFDVRHHVQQNLDALLLTMGALWRRRVRRVAAVAAGLIGVGALLFTQVGPFVKLSAILTSTIFGGFFAWFTRDLVAAVEKWRS
jgi:hypothetical protein